MQLFVTIGNDWKLLTIVTKSFVLDVYGSLVPTLVICSTVVSVSEKILGTSE